MLHHHVMLSLTEEATPDQIDGIVAGLLALPGEVPGLADITVHRDAGLDPGNAQIAFTMLFDDEASWRGYTPHPAHLALAKDWILPVLERKTAVQFVAS